MTNVWTRWWPLAGIAFVGLFIGSFAVTDGTPDTNADNSEIAAYFTSNSHQSSVIIGTLMILGAVLLFVWFLAMLREQLARSERGGPWTSLVYGSGCVAAALWIAADMAFASAAFAADDTSKFELDPNTYRILESMGYGMWVGGTTIALGMVAGTAIVALRTGLLPRWVTWLSFPVAATMLVSFFWIPFLIMCGWIIVVALVLITRSEAPAAAAGTA
jgi:hypothetical protein